MKISIAALIGTIIEILGLMFIGFYQIFVVCVHLFEIPLMVSFVLGKERHQMKRVIVFGYFFTMIINGVLEALWNQFGKYGSYIFYVLFSCGIVVVGVRIWKNYSKMQKGIFQVELSHQDKNIQTHAFYDSGNRLTDPYTGKGVYIVSEQLIKKIWIMDEENKRPVYIPYQSLGNETGILEVYYVDEVVIEGEKGRKIIKDCPVGVTKDNLFEGKKYEMILNEEVF